jgi:hypothetical protein
MEVKKTQLYAAELEVIADSLQSNYCRGVLKEAAERLRDLERVADFFQAEASRLTGIINGRKEICKGMYQKR